jgi:tetratricopeptide (TPR) repeat protein
MTCAALAVALLSGLLQVSGPVATALAAERPADVVSRAAALQASGRASEAFALVDSLEREARAARDASALALAATSRAGLLRLGGRPAEAEVAGRAATRYAEVVGDSTSLAKAVRWRAAALGDLRRGAEARTQWSRLLAIATARRDREYEGYARLGIAYLDARQGDIVAACLGNESAAQCFRDSARPYWEAWALTALGHLHADQGEIARARRAHLEAERVSREGGVTEYQQHAANNLGTLEYVAGDPARALAYFQRARLIGRQGGDARASLNAANNVAIMQTELGRDDLAAATLDTALAEARRRGFGDLEAIMLQQLGEIRRDQGRYAESAALLREAMARSVAAAPKNEMEAALALAVTLGRMDSAAAGFALVERVAAELGPRLPAQAMAEVELVLGESWLARGDVRRALERFRQAERWSRVAGWPRHAIRPLTLAARAWRSLGRPDSARAALERARVLWDDARGLASEPEWRERFGLDAHDLHVELASLLLDDPAVAEPTARAARAFDAVQPLKARTLLERVQGPERERAGRPVVPPATAASLSAALEPGERFLDVASGSEATLLFVVGPGGVRVHPLAGPPSAVAERLRLFGRLVSTPPAGDDPRAARALARTRAALGDWLLGALREDLRGARRIVFAPDGELHGLSLAALSWAEDGGSVLDSAEIAYVPSATVFLSARAAPHAPAGRGLLALGGPDPAGRPLAGARSEVRMLAAGFAEVDGHPAGLPVRDAASRMATSGLLHFAGHSELDDRRPWRSGLLLGYPPREDDDGWLRAADVARLALPAGLTVLASCSSAGGAVAGSEGVLGLSSAFLAAGVPTVVATLWPVDDRTSAALMRGFYRELSRGAPAAAALRRAQLDLRRDPRTAHPACWAGFVVAGEPATAVPLRPRARWAPWLAAVVVGAALAWSLRPFGRRRRVVTPAPATSPRG